MKALFRFVKENGTKTPTMTTEEFLKKIFGI